MQNFPQVGPEQLRKLRTDLAVHSPGDPVWEGAVGQLLQLLIDADLAHHRTAKTGEKKPLAGYKYPEDDQGPHSIAAHQAPLVEKKPEPVFDVFEHKPEPTAATPTPEQVR